MKKNFEMQVKALYQQANKIVHTVDMLKINRVGGPLEIDIPKPFKEEFLNVINQVNASLMEEDAFYGYFLFQTEREIRFDISSPTGINFKGAKYVVYFNPIIFLALNMKQMESSIKHEIHHMVALHLLRAKELKRRYSTLAINIAMDIVVNQHLDYLPPYATTLEKINAKYGLKLEPYETFEYYVGKLQTEMDLQEEDEEGEIEGEIEDRDKQESEKEMDTKGKRIETEYNPQRTHNLWEESDDVEASIVHEFTQKLVSQAKKEKVPDHLEEAIESLRQTKGELPWNLYLKRLMGTLESTKKKTVTRRNRRQPERLDLRGELRNHKAQIFVALDISGSIGEEEFKQAMKEVLEIVKNNQHELTVLECDNKVRREYKVKSEKDIKERIKIRGGTLFSPVFEYVNKKKIQLLIYFTDGQGERELEVVPKGYKVLWVISGRGDKLSVTKPYGAVKKLSKVEKNDKMMNGVTTAREGYSMNSQEPLLKM